MEFIKIYRSYDDYETQAVQFYSWDSLNKTLCELGKLGKGTTINHLRNASPGKWYQITTDDQENLEFARGD